MKTFHFSSGIGIVALILTIGFVMACGDLNPIDNASLTEDSVNRSSDPYADKTILSLWIDVTDKQLAYNANPSSALATEIADLLSDISDIEHDSEVVDMWDTGYCGFPCLADYDEPVGNRTLTCAISVSNLPKLAFDDDADLEDVLLVIIENNKETEVASLDTASRVWHEREQLAVYGFEVDGSVSFTGPISGKLKYNRVSGADLVIDIDIDN